MEAIDSAVEEWGFCLRSDCGVVLRFWGWVVDIFFFFLVSGFKSVWGEGRGRRYCLA